MPRAQSVFSSCIGCWTTTAPAPTRGFGLRLDVSVTSLSGKLALSCPGLLSVVHLSSSCALGKLFLLQNALVDVIAWSESMTHGAYRICIVLVYLWQDPADWCLLACPTGLIHTHNAGFRHPHGWQFTVLVRFQQSCRAAASILCHLYRTPGRILAFILATDIALTPANQAAGFCSQGLCGLSGSGWQRVDLTTQQLPAG